MSITLQKISYRQLREQSYKVVDDRYGIAAFMTEQVRQCMLACPNNSDDYLTAMHLAIADGIAVGRNFFLTTKFRAGDEVFPAQTGGSVEVHKDYRRRGIASMILGCNNEEHDIYIGALYSQGALAIYKKKGDVIIESPLFLKPRNIEFYLRAKGLKGMTLAILQTLVNGALKVASLPALYRKRKLRRLFTVERVQRVPEWAGELACNDGHKYMELHETAWLQWCLDYNMSDNAQDAQAFYVVTERNGATRGFFMTKVRNDEELGPYRHLNSGTVVEWGTTDEAVLSETDICMLAEDTFESKVSTILVVAQSEMAKKELKQFGYLRRGDYIMSFSDVKNRFADASDRSKWRIRFGCCNTIILKTSR